MLSQGTDDGLVTLTVKKAVNQEERLRRTFAHRPTSVGMNFAGTPRMPVIHSVTYGNRLFPPPNGLSGNCRLLPMMQPPPLCPTPWALHLFESRLCLADDPAPYRTDDGGDIIVDPALLYMPRVTDELSGFGSYFVNYSGVLRQERRAVDNEVLFPKHPKHRATRAAMMLWACDLERAQQAMKELGHRLLQKGTFDRADPSDLTGLYRWFRFRSIHLLPVKSSAEFPIREVVQQGASPGFRWADKNKAAVAHSEGAVEWTRPFAAMTVYRHVRDGAPNGLVGPLGTADPAFEMAESQMLAETEERFLGHAQREGPPPLSS